MPTTILASKLQPPSLQSSIINRARLIAQLDESLKRKLTLISAPAGFGKTTLLLSWLQTVRMPVAWLSLDLPDHEPYRFLRYLIGALQTLNPDLGQTALLALQGNQPSAPEAIMTALINDLLALQDTFVLVLDDYHLVSSDVLDEALSLLIQNMPETMHVIIATREDLRLPLARLRVQNQLLEVRVGDLRFTDEETADFLNQAMGLHLSVDDIRTLEHRTEGWVAGLQLAALSLRGTDDPTAFIENFTGGHRFIVDYLIEDVLHQQAPDIRQFLLHTSILNNLNGALCDAVVVGNASQKMLETLERNNLFVIALDEERHWYRYHHLFRDALHNALLLQDTALERTLHQRACDWYSQQDAPQDAIHHALGSGDIGRIAPLLEDVWREMSQSYHSAVWLQWAKLLPKSAILSRPLLCTYYGQAIMYTGDLDGCLSWYDHAESALKQADAVPDETSETRRQQWVQLPAIIASARMYIAMAKRDIVATLRHAEAIRDLVGESDDSLLMQAVVLPGLAQWAEGNLVQAEAILGDFVQRLQTGGRFADAVELVFFLSEIRQSRGDLHGAYHICEQAFHTVDELGVGVMSGLEDLHRVQADVYREQNQLTQAEDHLRAAEETVEQLVARPDWHHRLNVSWACLRLAQGDYDGALHHLGIAEAHFYRTPLPVVRNVMAVRVRVWIAQERLSEAHNALAGRGVNVDMPITYLHAYDLLTLVRLLLAQYRVKGDEGVVQRAHHLLQALLSVAQAHHWGANVIEILMLQALLADAQAKTHFADEKLQRALNLAQEQGFVRLFVDEGERMQSMLKRIAQPHNYAHKILASFAQGNMATPSSRPPCLMH
jgi:LuxR family maltose regulon positive regulatory protein